MKSADDAGVRLLRAACARVDGVSLTDVDTVPASVLNSMHPDVQLKHSVTRAFKDLNAAVRKLPKSEVGRFALSRFDAESSTSPMRFRDSGRVSALGNAIRRGQYFFGTGTWEGRFVFAEIESCNHRSNLLLSGTVRVQGQPLMSKDSAQVFNASLLSIMVAFSFQEILHPNTMHIMLKPELFESPLLPFRELVWDCKEFLEAESFEILMMSLTEAKTVYRAFQK